jgi:hypothetical protein
MDAALDGPASERAETDVDDRFLWEAECDAAHAAWEAMSAQERADSLNWEIDFMGYSDMNYWVAVAGQVVEEFSDEHQRLQREVALAYRRQRLIGIVRPLVTVVRGRARRGRRAASRRTSARAPGRPDRPAEPAAVA